MSISLHNNNFVNCNMDLDLNEIAEDMIKKIPSDVEEYAECVATSDDNKLYVYITVSRLSPEKRNKNITPYLGND